MQQLLAALDTPELSLVMLILLTLLFLLLLVALVQLGRLRRQLRRLLRGSSGESLEANLNRLLDEVEQLQQVQRDQQFQINRLAKRMSGSCGNLAIIRYNAFGEFGNDLSFSLALLDDEQNGVVITSIYGREENRIYAKPIEAGTSAYLLSEEEKAVIKRASDPTARTTEPADKNRR
ncbi:DUF4446 family protein [Brevibacillus marinus]|uniref:DUF4446 family protein n=1 Tax=Brevibacillus marinus TaxID=2496837 RepID=UPI000F82AD18|nr:DUF4446 family protein [Brevibacillus marinus]